MKLYADLKYRKQAALVFGLFIWYDGSFPFYFDFHMIPAPPCSIIFHPINHISNIYVEAVSYNSQYLNRHLRDAGT